jgi:hypothetical protein
MTAPLTEKAPIAVVAVVAAAEVAEPGKVRAIHWRGAWPTN